MSSQFTTMPQILIVSNGSDYQIRLALERMRDENHTYQNNVINCLHFRDLNELSEYLNSKKGKGNVSVANGNAEKVTFMFFDGLAFIEETISDLVRLEFTRKQKFNKQTLTNVIFHLDVSIYLDSTVGVSRFTNDESSYFEDSDELNTITTLAHYLITKISSVMSHVTKLFILHRRTTAGVRNYQRFLMQNNPTVNKIVLHSDR